MASCPQCAGAVPEGSRFCPGCAAPLEATSAETRTGLPAGVRRTLSSSDPSLDDARFLPGSMVADRYRVVGLLGRGGMGEVYRADDLKLGQPVALKFLPESVEDNPDRRPADRPPAARPPRPGPSPGGPPARWSVGTS